MTHQDNEIEKVLINDCGKKIEYTWDEFYQKFPNKEPHYVVSFIIGNKMNWKSLYVEEYITKGLLYNVQEEMFYYIIPSNDPFSMNIQIIPHNHPSILPSPEYGWNYIHQEFEAHKGEVTLFYIDKNGRSVSKFLGKKY